MAGKPGTVTGASAESIIAELLRRPLRAPPRANGALNHWQTFATMWRQQWHPASEDERWVHVTAAVTSMLIHLLLTFLLAWLMYVHFFAMRPVAEQSVTQVQYVGDGTPETPVQTPVPSPREAPPRPQAVQREATQPATPAPVRIEPPTSAVAMPAPVVEPVVVPLEREVPRPQPVPLAPQPLQVTRIEQPDIEFVLREPTPVSPEIPLPVVALPEPVISTREVAPVEIEAAPAVVQPQLRQPRIALPEPSETIPEVPTRKIPAPVVRSEVPVVPDIRPEPSPMPQQRPVVPRLQVSQQPLPEAADAPDAAEADSPAAVASEQAPAQTSEPSASPSDSATVAPATATTAAPSPPGTSSRAAPAAAWPAPTRGDDWGAALRDREGAPTGQPPGLFDETGRPRLADTPGQAPAGAPPGSAAQQAIDLERAGNWLKRPPYDYTPTIFDNFWVPNETLLQEWVRKGIRDISIPIPGTSKRIDCVVSLLQLGGGCMLADDNLNNQPATARPPPDVPFKPELQENQGALASPAREDEATPQP